MSTLEIGPVRHERTVRPIYHRRIERRVYACLAAFTTGVLVPWDAWLPWLS